MSNQLQITGGAKVRNLNGVITGTTGVLGSVPLGAANGVATLDSGGKVPVSQLPSSVVTYLGTWNAATNTPTLVNGTGDAGDLYICNVAGTVNFGAGPISFVVGDWVLYGSGTWQKSSGQNGTVTSVAVTETGDALTITGSPITTAGTINIGFAGTSAQYVAGDGTLITFPSLTGYVPYTGATSDVDLGTHVLNAQALHVKGTAGAGHLGLKHQTAAPTGSANESLIFADVNGNLGWQNDNLYLSTFVSNANTANRTYTLQNASGTLAFLSDIPSLAGYVTLATTQTISGTKTFTSTTTTSKIRVDNTLLSEGTTVAFKQYESGSLGETGYTSLAAQGSNLFHINWGGTKSAILDSVNLSTYRTYTLPNADGTLALTSDIPSLTGYVTLATTQTITGAKTFNNNLYIDTNAYWTKMNPIAAISGTMNLYAPLGSSSSFVFLDGDSGKSARFNFDNTANRIYTFPAATGTIALTSDIPSLSNYVTLDTTQTISGTKTFSSDVFALIGLFTRNSADTFIGTSNNTSGIKVNGTTTETKIVSGGNETATFTSDGNVGINTTTPGYTASSRKVLALNGGSAAGQGSLFAFMQGGVNKGYIFSIQDDMEFWCESGDVYIGNNANKSVIFKTQNAERVRILGTGNVGIGTTSPALKLDVVSTSQWDGIRVYNTSSAQGADIRVGNDANNNLGFLRVGGSASGGIYQNSLVIGTGGGYDIKIAPNGSLGLTVANGGAVTLSSTSGNSLTSTSSDFYASLTLQHSGGSNAGQWNLQSVSGAQIGATAGAAFGIYSNTASAYRLYINPSGNIGIGTSSPSYLLDVNGTFIAAGDHILGTIADNGTGRFRGSFSSVNTSSSLAKVQFGGGEGSQFRAYMEVRQVWNGSGTDQDVAFTTFKGGVGSAEAMIIKGNGNVGIGTTTPNFAATGRTVLDINGTSNSMLCLSVSGTAGSYLYQASGNLNISNEVSGAIISYTGGSERMRITSGGNVLIGTTSDAGGIYKLQVGSGGDVGIKLTSSTGAYSSRIEMGAGGAGAAVINGAQNIYIQSGGSGGVYLTSGGTSWISNSDERLKTDLLPIDNALSKVYQLRAVTGRYKTDNIGKSRSFLIAQDVQKVFPQAVNVNNDEIKSLGVQYTDIIPLLVGAIQELKAEIDELKNK